MSQVPKWNGIKRKLGLFSLFYHLCFTLIFILFDAEAIPDKDIPTNRGANVPVVTHIAVNILCLMLDMYMVSYIDESNIRNWKLYSSDFLDNKRTFDVWMHFLMHLLHLYMYMVNLIFIKIHKVSDIVIICEGGIMFLFQIGLLVYFKHEANKLVKVVETLNPLLEQLDVFYNKDDINIHDMIRNIDDAIIIIDNLQFPMSDINKLKEKLIHYNKTVKEQLMSKVTSV